MFGGQFLDKLPANESQLSTQEVFIIFLFSPNSTFFYNISFNNFGPPQNLLFKLKVEAATTQTFWLNHLNEHISKKRLFAFG
jgi:hypothetical protein